MKGKKLGYASTSLSGGTFPKAQLKSKHGIEDDYCGGHGLVDAAFCWASGIAGSETELRATDSGDGEYPVVVGGFEQDPLKLPQNGGRS